MNKNEYIKMLDQVAMNLYDVESIIKQAASSKNRMGRDFWYALGELQFYYGRKV